MSQAPYERPLLPWVLVVGTYAVVAALIVILSLTLYRAAERAGWRGQEERERIAKELLNLRDAHKIERAPEFDRFIREYLVEPRLLYCPEVAQHMERSYWPEADVPEDDMAYCYISGLTQKHSAGWAVAFDAEWNHPGRGANVLCIGGHVKWVEDPEELRQTIGRQLASRRAKLVGARVARPWWGRSPNPPPFVTADAEEERSAALPIVGAAAALAVVALILARLARRSSRRRREDRRPPDDRAKGVSGHGRPRGMPPR